jgi:hypothetical protein
MGFAWFYPTSLVCSRLWFSPFFSPVLVPAASVPGSSVDVDRFFRKSSRPAKLSLLILAHCCPVRVKLRILDGLILSCSLKTQTILTFLFLKFLLKTAKYVFVGIIFFM